MVSTIKLTLTLKVLIVTFVSLMPLIVALPDYYHASLAKKVTTAEKKTEKLLNGALRSKQRAEESRFGLTKSIHNAIGQRRWKSYEKNKMSAQRHGADLASY